MKLSNTACDFCQFQTFLAPSNSKHFKISANQIHWKVWMFSQLLDCVLTFVDITCTERLTHICKGPSVFGLPGYQGFWTSGQRADCTSPWVWKTSIGSQPDQDVSFTDWHRNEPNCIGGKENCLQMTTVNYRDQQWASVNCQWVLCPLCELDLWQTR